MAADLPTPAGALPGVGVLRARARWVLLAAVLGLVLGVGLDRLRAPVYESTAYLAVAPAPGDQGARGMARSAQALARLGTAPGIVGDALLDAGLPDVAAAPRLAVRVEAAPDAPVLSVTGRSADAATAQRIAETVSRTLAGVRTVEPFDAVLVGRPPLPRAPTMPGWVVPVGGAGVAGGLALVLAATLPVGGPRHQRADDRSRRWGLPGRRRREGPG